MYACIYDRMGTSYFVNYVFPVCLNNENYVKKKNTCISTVKNEQKRTGRRNRGRETERVKNENDNPSKNEIKQIILNVLFFTLFTKTICNESLSETNTEK